MEFDIRMLRESRALLSHYIRQTPLLPSQAIPGLWMKAENLQVTGSFKIRTALNQLLQLSGEQRRSGIVTSSSGNFAGGVSYASSMLGLSAKIVMMKSSNPVKVQKVRKYGSDFCFCGNSFRERQEMVRSIQAAERRTVIYPFDHPEAVVGNATIGLEIIEQCDRVKQVLVPVSGGGLISGIALALKLLHPGISIIGIQPEGSNATALSYHQKERINLKNSNTAADGLKVTEPGKLTFPLILELVDDMVTVSEESIEEATRLLIFHENLMVEPSGAVPIAAVLEGKAPSKDSVAVISGGNIDLEFLASLTESYGNEVSRINNKN
jgi:threonine dehydratase